MGKETETKKKLFFYATEYKKIGEIAESVVDDKGDKLDNITSLGVKRKDGEVDKDYHERKKQVIVNELIKALEKIDSKVENGDIFIGCNKERITSKGVSDISVFMEKDEIHDQNSKINGIVGRFFVEVDDKYDVDITIHSRFDLEGQNYFAATLLSFGEVNPFDVNVPCNDENLFDFLLIDLFAQRIREAYSKGLFRTYRRFEGNDDRVRGSIDVARHIRLNAGQKNGNIAYSYRENTVNNFLNILIVKAYQDIKRNYPSITERKIENDQTIHDFLIKLENETDARSVSVGNAIKENLKPRIHPYYYEYEEVRKICLSILRHEGLSIFDSDNKSVNSFLYYMPDLWENYLETILKKQLKNFENADDFVVETQWEKNKFIKKKDSDDFLLQLKPDYMICKKDKENKEIKKCKLILDAKMKPEWGKVWNDQYSDLDKKSKMSIRADVDECIRNMEVFGADGTGVIFPQIVESKEMGGEIENVVNTEDYKREISTFSKRFFYILPHEIPSRKKIPYQKWMGDFKDRSEKFGTMLLETVYKETF